MMLEYKNVLVFFIKYILEVDTIENRLENDGEDWPTKMWR